MIKTDRKVGGGAMVDDLKSFREVGIALGGVKNEIRIYAAIGVFTALAAGGIAKFAFDKLDRIEETVAEVKGIVTGIAADTSQARTDLTQMKLSLVVPQPVPTGTGVSEEDRALIAKFNESFEGSESMPYVKVYAAFASLPTERRQELQAGCKFAAERPEAFSVSTLGTCAAIVNADK
jgi:hypothetical protein